MSVNFIFNSDVNIGYGVGDFCVCEDEHYVCTPFKSVTTYLVAFLVSFIYPTLSKYQNLTSTFGLVSIFIVDMVLVNSVCVCVCVCVCTKTSPCKWKGDLVPSTA